MGKKKTSRKRSGSWSPFKPGAARAGKSAASDKAKSEETAVVPPKPPPAPPRVEERAATFAPPAPPKPKAPAYKAERYVVPEKEWLAIDTIQQVKGAWGIVASPTTPEVVGKPLGIVNSWKERIKARAAELKITVGVKGRKRRG